jgi:hypothetical protein
MRRFFPARCGRAFARLPFAVFLVAGAIPATNVAASPHTHDGGGFEQHHAHEHGKVTVNIAIDRGDVVIELAAPAVNVVGFEHAPGNDHERNAVLNAAALIRGGHQLFTMPEGAKCQFVKTDFTDPAFEQNEAAGDEDHSHADHADYEARFSYRCADPKQLDWIEPTVLAKLLNVTEARVNVIAPSGQRSEVVQDAHSRIRLR